MKLPKHIQNYYRLIDGLQEKDLSDRGKWLIHGVIIIFMVSSIPIYRADKIRMSIKVGAAASTFYRRRNSG